MQHPKWFNTSPTSKLFIMILTVVVGKLSLPLHTFSSIANDNNNNSNDIENPIIAKYAVYYEAIKIFFSGCDCNVVSQSGSIYSSHYLAMQLTFISSQQHDQFRYQVEQNNSPSIHHIPQKQLIKSNNNTSTGKSMLIK
ncbi:hypothetical protein GQX74_004266 [Glossina fuscipes]|nr:hypothetical protein GQX74_004266 [Glossina fuscipes]